jgi:Ni,Fe-hydrogenase III small subunit
VIHKFHDGQARELYKQYEAAPDLRLVVAQAVAEGILTQEEIPGSVWPHIESVVEFFRQESGR